MCLLSPLLLFTSIIHLTHLTHLARLRRAIRVLRCLSAERQDNLWSSPARHIRVGANVFEGSVWLLSRVLSRHQHGGLLPKAAQFLVQQPCLLLSLLLLLLLKLLLLLFFVLSRQRLQEVIHAEHFRQDREVLRCILERLLVHLVQFATVVNLVLQRSFSVCENVRLLAEVIHELEFDFSLLHDARTVTRRLL